MAPTTSRKRKRLTEQCPIAEREGDVVAVIPRQQTALNPSTQPTKSTKPRADISEIGEKHADIYINDNSVVLQDTASVSPLPVNQDVDQIIPQHCCYHCLTRGGNAAYECVTKEGKARCTRCIRDKKNQCRIPTDDEAVAIAARCPRCTLRGFKKCDGGNPCNTCRRNKTPHLCRKEPEKKFKLGHVIQKDTNHRTDSSAPVRSYSSQPASHIYNGENRNGEMMTPRSSRGAFESSGNATESLVLPLRQHGPTTNPVQISLGLVHATEGMLMFGNSDAVVTYDTEISNDSCTSNLRPKKRAKQGCTLVPYTEKATIEFSDEDNIAQAKSIPVDAALSSSDNDDDSSQSSLYGNIIDLRDSKPNMESRKLNKIGGPDRPMRGVDLRLPPLSNIEDCMSHMAAKAVDLGLLDSLNHLAERPIRIATMCSGTESPLLALDEISKALEKKEHHRIRFEHAFSAEIEVFKQAFIERNFHPRILFRDVRDFICDSATTAITAYGAEVDIPNNVDVLVAGFTCKDLSRLNAKGKTLEDGGESGDTWLAVYTYAERFRPSIVLLENVKSERATWDDVVSRWDKIGYEAAWLFCDTKRYYLPQTRERMYMVAIERDHFGKGANRAVGNWKTTMQLLERPCSSPYEAFIPKSFAQPGGYSTPKAGLDWAMCKLRNDHIRSEKKLGILSPISRRNDYGTVMPPDFADRKFYNAQSSRVHDAIDIAHLEAAQKGFDSLYKMALWDVSQNVDRFKAELGIAPCITPGGQDFASNRQCALNGSELLLLQGMPLAKLILANETQKDLQNLAGNAMSTTVIGASLISALISGSRAFRPSCLANNGKAYARETVAQQTEILVQSKSMQRTLLEPRTYQEIDLNAMKQEAMLSARMCNCESMQLTSKSTIRICSACGHSACTSCAGNPKHVYEEAMPSSHREQSPHNFISKWRSEVPTRLELELFPIVRRLTGDVPALDPMLSSYLDLARKAQDTSRYFYLGDFVREHHHWKVTYNAPHAWLELRVSEEIEWLIFLRCPPELPGNSSMRDFLRSPIAHSTVNECLFAVEWKVRLPHYKSSQIRISDSSEQVRSWRNRLGLQHYKEETVPSSLKIHSNDHNLAAVMGVYEHLPYCGTACNSLYRKTTKDEHLFLFLDPDLIGNPNQDTFIFSRDIGRKSFGDGRIILACMDATWRPWLTKHESAYTVNVTTSDAWVPATIKLQPACVPLDVRFFSGKLPRKNCIPLCSQSLIFLDVLAHSTSAIQTCSDYLWALEQPRSLSSCSSWQTANLNSTSECPCAPPYPKLIWSVNAKGVATAQEDRKAAAVFERAIKQRPLIFHLKVSSEGSSTRIQVALNIMSLMHRSWRRFSGPEENTNTAWRLITDHVDLPPRPFRKFRLQNNANDIEKSITAVPTYLRGTQLKSLQWMIAQELGKKIVITETEEAINNELGWRVEARVEREKYVRGGVLADQPSFGKTVTTIGLIQSDFDMHTPEALLKGNQFSAKNPGLIDSIATLIVCPLHIARQWRSELQKFLPANEFESYNILIIEEYTELQALGIEDVLASRVIVVSWTIFAQEYVSELAYIAALPEPAMTSRHGIDAWIERVVQEIPNQLNLYRKHGYTEFERLTKKLAEERLKHPDFTATLPLKIQHGSAYQSFSAMLAAVNTTKGSKEDVKPSRTRDSSCIVPLFHLFQFNRIVVDEYHYLNDAKKVESHTTATLIKRIFAHKRWILSGTPALENFSEVNEIASFLGVNLGRHHPGDGVVTTLAEKSRDQTAFECFIHQTEVVSRQWHEARRLQAQRFLDGFVRQNDAEIQHIPFLETLSPVSLDAAHHAVYVELSQHLISQRMQIKKLSKKSDSDRTNRLNDSLENSASAEEALLKSALLFKTEDGISSLDLLTTKRSRQLCSTENELKELISGFEDLALVERRMLLGTGNKAGAEPNISDLYSHFKNDIVNFNWLGDDEASNDIRRILSSAEKQPKPGFPELTKASNEQRLRLSKQRLSQLRDVSLEFARRKRSQRFIQSIRQFLQSETSSRKRRSKCSSPGCHGNADRSQLYSIPHCGHTACSNCLGSRTDDEHCVSKGCTAYAIDGNLIRMADLGSSESQTSGQPFGKKLETIIHLVMRIASCDQGVVFAPNQEVISILEEVFKHNNISYSALSQSRRSASAKVIEEFKTNKNPKTRKKLLILNLGSESAAGVNLTNANHIIFVSPLLAKTQYEYDAAMAQAIARSRRYGQDKKVYIYHVVAERTIDVDILEHRHKRSGVLSTLDTTTTIPSSSCAKKEGTRLVKNKEGEAMLVPRSWLKDISKNEVLGIEESHDTFTSLISFPGMFERGDHDDDNVD